MICAMRLHDPCEHEVRERVLAILGDDRPTTIVVPLCDKHTGCWDSKAGPFVTWTDEECLKWANWAAARAKRQEARTA